MKKMMLRSTTIWMVELASVLVLAGAVHAQSVGPLNSPVRSQDPSTFNSDKVLSHLAPQIWRGENLAYDKPAPTIAKAQTEYAKMMQRTIQEVVKGKVYHAYGFQLASTLIVVGENGLILVDPGSDDDSARDTRDAFRKAAPQAADLPVVAVIYSHRHPDHAFGAGGWGVTQADVDAAKVKIIASENLVTNLVNDVGVVGNILTQRTAYAAGYVPAGPEGPVHWGIGPAFGAGPVSFFLPTVKVKSGEPLKTTISGVRFEIFHAYGDAGTDEIDVWLPDLKHVHGSETVQGETFPNLYTLRGTSYRDVQLWMEGVNTLLGYAKNANTYSGSHMRAWTGNDFIVERIRNYRDAIQYVHDQTIKLINLGYTRDELAEMVVLPEPFRSDPWLQEYYGTVAHSVRSIYDGYLGWWEGDPTQLARPSVKAVSEQYVRTMGGRDAVMKEARTSIDKRNYGWAAEIITHLVNVDPSDMAGRKLKAEALRKWAYLQTNIYWRAYGISASKELDGSLDRSRPWNFADPAIVAVLPTIPFLETMRVRLNAKRAEGASMAVQFEVTDTKEKAGFEVRNRIAAFTAGALPAPDATIKGPKSAILQTIATGKFADGITVGGNKAAAEKFLALFDTPTPNGVNLVLPPGTELTK